MPTIYPALVPTLAPGTLFNKFTGDNTLNIRWLTPQDPVFYEVVNRPTADLALRTLILAKTVDQLYASLGQQALYPFLVQPIVGSGTNRADVPINWIWGLNICVPQKWSLIRLARVKRIAGVNDPTSGYTGYIRLIFTAVQLSAPQIEVALFYTDYQIDSILTYQNVPMTVCTVAEEPISISPEEAETVSGTITFRTMDTNNLVNAMFLELCAPPTANPTVTGFLYNNPTVYEVVDTIAGGMGVTDDYSLNTVPHGTGLISESAWTALPYLGADAQSWLNAFNYPFELAASRTSSDSITMPLGMFCEFQIVVPAGQDPTSSSDPTYFPVWITRAELISNTQITLYFATHNTTDPATGGQPSLTPVEFAYTTLASAGRPGDRLAIIPLSNLKFQSGTDASEFSQHFGRGHLVLSSVWSPATNQPILDWYFAMSKLLSSPQYTTFSIDTTRISSFGISSVPQYTPTVGQSRALTGSTSRLQVPVNPDETNRYVTEADQGLGDTVDLESLPGITPHPAISRYGYTGSLCHKVINLIVDTGSLGSDPNFYSSTLLPRLTILLGRPPIFGDVWFDGVRFKWFNGDAWQD